MEPERYACLHCGHSRPWHQSTSGRCQFEIRDEDGSWMACGCEALVVRIA